MKTIYERFFKRTLLAIFIIHLSLLNFATTYYVSNAGNDSNNGTSTTTSWLTLAKVNSKTFAPGDQILFQRGDTFYGNLVIKNSGSSGSPITFDAYGTGANPIITGFTTATGWTNLGSNIWESSAITTSITYCNMVAVGGVNTAMGRYPNADAANGGYLTYQSFTTNTSITSSSLSGTPNWTGATAVIRKERWILDKNPITSQSGGTLNYSGGGYYGQANWGFFLQNDARTLDVQNEWYYNPTTKKIKIYSTSSPTNVQVSSIDNLISIGGSYITIKNLTVNGANVYGIFMSSISHVNIENCSINFTGRDGAHGENCSYLTAESLTIDSSNNGSIQFWTCPNNTVRNCVITNNALYAGMALSGSGSGTALLALGSNTLIEYNRVINSGCGTIMYKGDNCTVQYNFIDGCASIKDDGGGIYTYGASTGSRVLYNIVLNGIGAGAGTNSPNTGAADGIYMDESASNVEIAYNTVAGFSEAGMQIHVSSDMNIHDNLLFDNASQIYMNQDGGNDGSGGAVTNENIQNNIMFPQRPDQYTYYIRNSANIFNFFGVSDNNYFCRPIFETNLVKLIVSGVSLTYYSFEGWKTLTGMDANSHKLPQAVNSLSDLQFEYNATKSPKIVSLSRPMIDVKGTKYASSVTLQPFTSVVLMKDNTPATVPDAPTSVVATSGNASASVTFVAPVNNGGSTITGYTVTSIPAGGIDGNAGSTSLNHTITGLTNGTSYTFTVKATNSVGSSLASTASNSVTPKAPAATAFTFTGPTSGNVNSASSNFTVTPNNSYTGTITVTPSGMGSAGLSPKVLTFSSSAIAQTFKITPTVAGSITLTATNNGTLINPVPITYTTNAILPDAPTSVVATSADGSVSVTFMAPTNTGGSAITGYTVTSSPAGGIDSNAGSTSLNHTITGLTNGTYTFTVKATSSVGSSVASVASNPIENIITKQGEIVPSHFTTVWQGLNGFNHMNINVLSAMLEDIPLSVDDEIAVFSGSACVGTSKLTKSIVPTDNSTFLTILASQNDGSGNGFTDNDTIVFKIWNNQTKNELQVNSVVFRNDVSTWKTNGRYSPGATTVVEIASYQVYTQSIELLKGYNMISTYVSAQNPNVTNVTKTLVDQGNLIKMQDEIGNSFENWGSYGGWINQLGSLEETEGYKIQVANNCTLQVSGRSISMPFDISLKTGWNIISYPRTDFVNAMNVFQTLIDQNKLVKVQDEAGNSIENWGLFGGWKNSIGNLIPGKAYKVKINTDAILTFQESYPKSALVLANTEQTEYYHSSVEGNGTDHMNINITGLSSIGISAGDELAAFDGTVCVATTKVTEANLLSGSASLASSFSTNNQNPNGFNVGDQIQISIWSKLSGDESKVNTEVISGQMKYEKNASVLVKMKSITIATSVVNLNDAVKIDVFPNPCQSQVTVRFSEIPEANSRIEIFDISGRKLVSRVISGTSEEFNLESFTPGLYLVKSILGSKEFVQKLIVNK